MLSVSIGNLKFSEISLVELTKLLLDTGADPNARDDQGNTPLLQIQHLLEQGLFLESVQIAQLLLLSSPSTTKITTTTATTSCVDPNHVNVFNRTLLSYSVTYGDASSELTRLLLNHGASVWPSPEVGYGGSSENTTGDIVDQLTKERDMAAFTWFLKSVMERHSLENTDNTVYLLSTAMGENPQRMKRHVTRIMLQLGKGAAANGSLFLRLKLQMMPYWSKPQDLRYQCMRRIRKSMGPKRLATSGEKKLRIPTKLQKYIKLEERMVSNSTLIDSQYESTVKKMQQSITYQATEIAKALKQ